jgi:D-alanine-D-alanine ligase
LPKRTILGIKKKAGGIIRILILSGGNSSERTVSLTSARTVKKALQENGHKVKLYDLRQGYAGIVSEAKNFDVLFPVLHGEEGEAGPLHKFLVKIGEPIVGTRNYKGLSEAWNKIPFKKYCDKNGIETPSWTTVRNKADVIKFGFPCVLKASNGGSSREVVILKTAKDMETGAFKKLIKSDMPLFVEKYFKGTEVTVGILDGKVLPFIEIIPPKNSWFSYENKYAGSTQEIPFAPSVPKEKQQEIAKVFLKIQNHFNLGTYFRIDFIVSDGIPYVLDVNTIPGLTPGSLFPKQALAAGLSFPQMLEKLIHCAK